MATASSSSADRNLLFGILALQMDFVTKDALVAAMNSWLLAKDKPLGSILTEQGALDQEHHQLLSALVQAHLKKHNNDPEQSLAAASISPMLQQQLQALRYPDWEASLAHLGAASAHSVATVSHVPADAGVRYRILRPHAKGGLGEVFVAEDTELRREVALKEIQVQHASHESSRGRFVQEAKITGGLEHPGIVPVYGLGNYADGRPFYAMRFVRGDNLKTAIRKFHEASPGNQRPGDGARSPRFDSLAFRQLLGRFLDVCNAIAYAHNRGVLHRDLKPGNVMLGEFGETLVVDWGLAKIVGRAADAFPPTADTTLRPQSENGAVDTVAGSAVGTPAYMSPEQAEGKLDQLGPATDVYSLGATLYCLLTGQAPAGDGPMADILEKVRNGDIPPADTVCKGVPKPLAAICKKAMALCAAERHASALALAADIEHWLADEPVSCCVEPRLVRIGRFGRKHRGLVSGVAAALVVVVVGLAIGLAVVGGLNHRLDQANTELATRNTQLADANSDLQESNANLDRARKHEVDLRISESKLMKQLDQERRVTETAEAAALSDRQSAAKAYKSDYIANVVLAQYSWENSDIPKLVEYLDQSQPRADRPELRGWEWRYLRSLAHQESLTLKGHKGDVNEIDWSPDGARMVSGGYDGQIGIWDVKTGQALVLKPGGAKRVGSVAWHPKANLIAASNEDGAVVLWDDTGKELVKKNAHANFAEVAWDPTGNRWASAGRDGWLRLWDAQGKELASHRLAGRINSISWSADGAHVVVAIDKKYAQILDPGSGEVIRTLSEIASSAKWSPDGATIVTVDSPSTVVFFDASQGKRLFSLKAQNDNPTVPSRLEVTWSRDSRAIAMARATVGAGGGVAVLDVVQKRQTRQWRTGSVHRAVWSPDGATLATAGKDGLVKLWNAAFDQTLREFASNRKDHESIAWSPDGRHLVTGGWWLGAGPATLWRFVDVFGTCKPILEFEESVKSLAWEPRGQRVALGTDSHIVIYNVATKKREHKLPSQSPAIEALAWNPKAGVLAAGCRDGTVELWDTTTGQEIRKLTGRKDQVLALAWHPVGVQIAAAGQGHTIDLWNTTDGMQRVSLPGHPGNTIMGLDWSRDGKQLASCGGMEIKVWDMATGKHQFLTGHLGPVTCVAWHPDGTRLASCGFDRTVKLWDSESGRLLLNLQPRQDFARKITWSPDGRRLAGGTFARITLWDAP